jgi:hypothetical protein
MVVFDGDNNPIDLLRAPEVLSRNTNAGLTDKALETYNKALGDPSHPKHDVAESWQSGAAQLAGKNPILTQAATENFNSAFSSAVLK